MDKLSHFSVTTVIGQIKCWSPTVVWVQLADCHPWEEESPGPSLPSLSGQPTSGCALMTATRLVPLISHLSPHPPPTPLATWLWYSVPAGSVLHHPLPTLTSQTNRAHFDNGLLNSVILAVTVAWWDTYTYTHIQGGRGTHLLSMDYSRCMYSVHTQRTDRVTS